MTNERASAFTRRSIKASAKLAGLKLVVSMMDLTTLEGSDTPGKIAFLCRKAMQPADSRYQVANCAAVCAYPEGAIAPANNSPYGLSAGVWSDKGSKIFKIVRQLRAGVLWADTYNKFDPSSPFGGYKESGLGREGGRRGLLPYLSFN